MSEPIFNPKDVSLELIEEKITALKNEIESANSLKGIDLDTIRKEFEALAQSLAAELSADLSKIDTNVNDRVAKAIEQLITIGQEATRRDGNVNLSLWKVLDQVKNEIQNIRKKVIVERAGKTELGGGSTDSDQK